MISRISKRVSANDHIMGKMNIPETGVDNAAPDFPIIALNSLDKATPVNSEKWSLAKVSQSIAEIVAGASSQILPLCQLIFQCEKKRRCTDQQVQSFRKPLISLLDSSFSSWVVKRVHHHLPRLRV